LSLQEACVSQSAGAQLLKTEQLGCITEGVHDCRSGSTIIEAQTPFNTESKRQRSNLKQVSGATGDRQ
jgi:hypothetical protein